MLAILFPHMYEELEFLIPPVVEIGGGISTGNEPPAGGSQVMNAVAGPSRLP